ncbi:hypothetical protein C6P08_02100 [Weissella confusa]|uniref:hypothetical protein n=1 Tax=Weissella confusa TaxID=1583 RepID=UPI0010926A86|nr:hypothetical protein [Weissella confusa]MBJ7694206.1 hypothetical protein [Weissella confusa]QBZ04054.1 hypothetical protein C6P08_02100 [Weissella confusa]
MDRNKLAKKIRKQMNRNPGLSSGEKFFVDNLALAKETDKLIKKYHYAIPAADQNEVKKTLVSPLAEALRASEDDVQELMTDITVRLTLTSKPDLVYVWQQSKNVVTSRRVYNIAYQVRDEGDGLQLFRDSLNETRVPRARMTATSQSKPAEPQESNEAVDALKSQIDRLEKANKTLKAKNVAAGERVQELERELKQANTVTTQETAALSDQLETAQATQHAAQQLSHQRQLGLEHQATRLEELKNQVTEYESLHRNESNRITELEEALHEADESMARLQEQNQVPVPSAQPNTDYKETVIRTLANRITELEQRQVTAVQEVAIETPQPVRIVTKQAEPVVINKTVPVTDSEALSQLIAHLTRDNLAAYRKLPLLVQKYNDLTNDDVALWMPVQGRFYVEDNDRYFVDTQGHLIGMDQIDLNGLEEASLNAEETYSARVRTDTHAVQLLRSLGKLPETKAAEDEKSATDSELERSLFGKHVLIVSWFGASAKNAANKINEVGGQATWLDGSKYTESKVIDEIQSNRYDVGVVLINGSHHHTVKAAWEAQRAGQNIQVTPNAGMTKIIRIAMDAL